MVHASTPMKDFHVKCSSPSAGILFGPTFTPLKDLLSSSRLENASENDSVSDEVFTSTSSSLARSQTSLEREEVRSAPKFSIIKLSIRIPLRSPFDERNENACEIDNGDNNSHDNSQLWSTAAQRNHERNSLQSSQGTVISFKADSLVSGDKTMEKTQINKSPITTSAVGTAQTLPITSQVTSMITSAVEQKSETPPKQISQEETMEETTIVLIESANGLANGGTCGSIRTMSKARSKECKRILFSKPCSKLFSTKIGSGSEE